MVAVLAKYEGAPTHIIIRKLHLYIGMLNALTFYYVRSSASIRIANLYGDERAATFYVTIEQDDCTHPLVDIELASKNSDFKWTAVASSITLVNLPRFTEFRAIMYCTHSKYALVSNPFWFSGKTFVHDEETTLRFVNEQIPVTRFNSTRISNPYYKVDKRKEFQWYANLVVIPFLW
jgi:hypothetical protein